MDEAVPSTTSACSTATGRRLNVGAGLNYATPSAAAAAAADGDVVVIQGGDYTADVAVWRQNNLTICGDGGRARLFAGGADAQGKAIWVVQGRNVVIENVEFHDAKVADGNGAGIRAEGDGLTLRNTGFYDNETGILGPSVGQLLIDQSEFARNGNPGGGGFNHNIYVGRADRVVVTSSFFHGTQIGHNFKSRARETRIERSYFMDGQDGRSSYLVNVPNGGVVVLRGNLLQKGPLADNSRSVAYGEEGLTWPVNTLELSYNTMVSKQSRGRFVQVAAGVQRVTMTANLFAGTDGPTTVNPEVASSTTQAGNLLVTAASFPNADNLLAPNFWPTAPLASQLQLPVRTDPNYVADAPAPYVTRYIATRTGRLVGALQSPP